MYRNEILQGNMRLTAFFKLYKMCTLLHRCDFKILAKKKFEKSEIFVKIENSAKSLKRRKKQFLKMLQNLQDVAEFQKFQQDNLVYFERC